MNDEAPDTATATNSAGGPGADLRPGPGPEIMSAQTLAGNKVYNLENEQVGNIQDIMLDTRSGRVRFAVLSFGDFLGMGEKLFAVPWMALELDTKNKRFVLDVSKIRLKDAPRFDKDNWPNMADQSWARSVHAFYRTQH